jgi:hypothetical protein
MPDDDGSRATLCLRLSAASVGIEHRPRSDGVAYEDPMGSGRSEENYGGSLRLFEGLSGRPSLMRVDQI